MASIQRLISRTAFSEELLGDRMSFIAGPRQIGKTTLVRRFLAEKRQGDLYYNWDTLTVKRRFSKNALFFVEDLPPHLDRPWVALDEIHKYPNWKNLLKGYYDEWGKKARFVVTGSARLDHFRKSGDSLVGRYFLFRMLPLGAREVSGAALGSGNTWSPGEALASVPMALPKMHASTESLLSLTGFPEPLASGRMDFCNRWRENHVSLILQEDLRDLTRIAQIKKLETLLYLLPERVGSPLSLNALRGPLETAYGSVRLWLEAMKMVYLVFSIEPWSAQVSRSILKEKKYYFWDWGMVEDSGSRFENFTAAQLERVVSHWNEMGKGPFKLYYLRTKEGQEVDFAVADHRRVRLLVEAKAGDTALSPHLAFFQKKLNAELAVQVVFKKDFCSQKDKALYVMGADRFFSLMP